MIEYYLPIRSIHIGCAIASGAVFLLRGLLMQIGRNTVANHVSIRYLSYSIDTALLTAALMLLTMLRLSPIATPWLATKILLLLGYIVLGTLALRRARTLQARLVCFLSALLAYTLMIGIARAHDPLGWLSILAR